MYASCGTGMLKPLRSGLAAGVQQRRGSKAPQLVHRLPRRFHTRQNQLKPAAKGHSLLLAQLARALSAFAVG